jgi:hypothetical protein
MISNFLYSLIVIIPLIYLIHMCLCSCNENFVDTKAINNSNGNNTIGNNVGTNNAIGNNVGANNAIGNNVGANNVGANNVGANNVGGNNVGGNNVGANNVGANNAIGNNAIGNNVGANNDIGNNAIGNNSYPINNSSNSNNSNLNNESVTFEQADANSVIDNDLSTPNMVIENIGTTKLIIHWQNNQNDNMEISNYLIKVYACPGLNSECNIEEATEVENIETPLTNCNSCYAIVNNIDMTQNTYIVQMQIVYQNKATGSFVTTPAVTKTVVNLLEHNLDKMYQDALNHLVADNLNQKKVSLEQTGQKIRIDGLKTQLATLRAKLSQDKEYTKKIARLDKPPFPIKTYFNKVDMYDPQKQPQQTIDINGKEYYLGMV